MRIVKLEYNDGTVKYQIKHHNFRGGWILLYMKVKN